jgi:hypothetical protein
MWKQNDVAILKYSPNMSLEGLRKITRTKLKSFRSLVRMLKTVAKLRRA